MHFCTLALAVPLLFVAPAQSSPAQESDQDLGLPSKLYTYTVGEVGLFKLNCSSLDPDVDGSPYTWRKNNTPVEKVKQLSGRYALEQRDAVFHLTARATEDDYGDYECSARGRPEARWNVTAMAVLNLPDDTSAVEGLKMKLTCKVVGKPYPQVSWYYGERLNESRPVSEVLGDRAQVKEAPGGAPGALLTVNGMKPGDEGRYHCVADGAYASTMVRVKGEYAALWPFLGMCVEVLVLCAAILVYERRRAKPEPDDDTADHDQ